ncbi:hypothetical protein [Flagellimonas abyssi]|uniref:Uncharacterized protein n=1 Tax=Flagellimonas abyssi TaxID=2864871 RepID=A0ABS7ETP9_9FLAO|nr:hypothetical protein [Allomuricauda abyssi]MBW8200930.1 hypothetical protein [Allomuricauda abyssi]
MLKRYILIISAIINIVSILAILGWMFQLESLTRVVSELPSMKFNTALCFIFLGATIVLIVKHYNIVFAHIVNAFLLIVGLLTLSQDIFAIDLGIDQFIVEDFLGYNQVTRTRAGCRPPLHSLFRFWGYHFY